MVGVGFGVVVVGAEKLTCFVIRFLDNRREDMGFLLCSNNVRN